MAYKDKAQQREYQRKWIARRRLKYLPILGVACAKCGSVVELELDHINSKLKLDHKIWSWTPVRMGRELKKCQILCRVCHVVKSIEEQNYPNRKHGTLTMYKKGRCRCEDCKKANSTYECERRLGKRIAVIRID